MRMQIKEVEEIVRISRQNIRFYEKQGLLHPSRNSRNDYREYGEDDIFRLKQIRFFRKLGMPVEEIRRLLNGETDLITALSVQKRRLTEEMDSMKAAVRFIGKIHESDPEKMDIDSYLRQMEEEEKHGAVFTAFADDFRKTTLAETKRSFGFKPDTMCMSPEEFTMELCKYAEQNQLNLVITKEGMSPEFTIDGIEYIAKRSFGRFGASISCTMKHPEDYVPSDMSEEKYKWTQKLYHSANICCFLLIMTGMCITWMFGKEELIMIPLLIAAVYIGILIWWHNGKRRRL